MASSSIRPDPRSRGFLGGWASRALLWSATTRRLLTASDTGQKMLSLVSMYLCLWEADRLLHGVDGSLRGDPVARADCPIDHRDFRRIVERYQRLRDSILHLADRTADGHGWTWSFSREAPYSTFTVAIDRDGEIAKQAVSQREMEELLDALDPWLRRHWERLIEDGAEPMDAHSADIPIA